MTTPKSINLEQFAEEMRREIDSFVADYKRQHEANPEQFPLELDGDNTGLWFEFFTEFNHRENSQ